MNDASLLNLFYAEPEGDRWLPLDRYPRRLVRRLVRGKRKPGGMERYYLNLVDGLQRAGIGFRSNRFAYARRHFEEPVGIVGKAHLLRTHDWRNPIIFGPAVFSHPAADLAVFRERPIRKVLVSCEWMKQMYQQAVDVPVEVWASGVDTYTWCEHPKTPKDIDALVYDKIRWEREKYEPELIQPITKELTRRGLRFQLMRYGGYQEEDYHAALTRSRSMIFLVEHETQGFAYLQALASGVPILAWDRGGFWQDPEFYPHKVKFRPVTSVPYWDQRCGMKFSGKDDLQVQLENFLAALSYNSFKPREYVLENLTLETCARKYAQIVRSS